MADIFISYAHEDRAPIEALARALETAGYSVWWDRNIAVGAQFSKETAAELKAAKAVLVAWSPASQDSHWVADEAAEGRDTGRLIPISLDGTLPPLGFRQFQTIDFSPWKTGAEGPFADLSKAIAEKLKATPRPIVAPGFASAKKPFSRAVLAAGAAGLAAIAALAFMTLQPKPAAPPATVAAAATPTREGRKETYGSIAVLAFVDMSEAKDQEYFSDGITEELLNALAQNDKLRVAARTSAFVFKGRQTPLKEIAAALNVETILEGSVRRADDRIRISAQLIDAETGFHLWSDRYDRDLKDIFAVQDEIAAAIVGQLNKALTPAAAPARPKSVKAYEHYLAGNFEFEKRTVASLARARAEFAEAIRIEPEFGPAHARLASVWASSGLGSWGDVDQVEAVRKAKAAYAQAVKLAPEAPETLRAGGSIALQAGDTKEQVAILTRLVSAHPSYVEGKAALAQPLRAAGHCAEAFRLTKEGQTLDPLNLSLHRELAYDLLCLGRPDEAISSLGRALEFHPESGMLLNTLSFVLSALGDLSGVVKSQIDLLDIDHANGLARSHLGLTFAEMGFKAEALKFSEGDARTRMSVQYILAEEVRLEAYPELLSADTDPVDQIYFFLMARADEAAMMAIKARLDSYDDIPNVDEAVYAAPYVFLLRRAGRADEAAQVNERLGRFITAQKENGVADAPFLYLTAAAAAARGDKAGAIAALEKIVGRFAATGDWPHRDSIFDELRGDARFEALLARDRAHLARERQETIDAGLVERALTLLARIDAEKPAPGK